MFFDPIDGPQFSATAVVKLQANATTDFSAPSVDVTLSLDTVYNVFTHFFSSDQVFRFWRVNIVDVDNSNLHVEIPTIVLADTIGLTQGPEIGFVDRITDRSRVKRNEFGNEFYDLNPKQHEEEFQWMALLEADKVLLKTMFREAGNSTPVLFALDPFEATFVDKDEYALYGRLVGAFEASQQFFTFFTHAIRVREAF